MTQMTLNQFIDDILIAFDNGFGRADSIFKMAKALRSIGVYHLDEDGDCKTCLTEDGTYYLYPCPTIELIERILNES